MCKATEVTAIDNTTEEHDKNFFIGSLISTETKQEDWMVNLNKNEHSAVFKIDNGAQCNVVSERFSKTVGLKYNQKT